MEERLINQAPFIPLWYDEVVHLVQPTVQGWQPNALNRLDLRRVKKRPPAK
jgi:peptide/nickel transport system substrate-binding protein